MRIMATSDLHGNLEGIDPNGADVVVLAGDIAPLKGRGVWHINEQKNGSTRSFANGLLPNRRIRSISDRMSWPKPYSKNSLVLCFADTSIQDFMAA